MRAIFKTSVLKKPHDIIKKREQASTVKFAG